MSSEVNFLEREYASFTEFEKALDEYQRENCCVFRKKSTDTAEKSNRKTVAQIPEGFIYARCHYVCTHFGHPVYRGKGTKIKTKHSATGCEAKFTLNFDHRDGVLRINKWNLVHNHPTTPETFSREYKVKRLTAGQREELKEIVRLNPRNEDLKQFLNAKYGKALSLKDVRYLKSQLKSEGIGGETDLLNNLQDLEKHGGPDAVRKIPLIQALGNSFLHAIPVNNQLKKAKSDLESFETSMSTDCSLSDESPSSSVPHSSSIPIVGKPQNPQDTQLVQSSSSSSKIKRSLSTIDAISPQTVSQPKRLCPVSSLTSRPSLLPSQQPVSQGICQAVSPSPSKSNQPSLDSGDASQYRSHVQNSNSEIASFLAYLKKRDEEAMKLRQEELMLRRKECLVREKEVNLQKQRFEFDRTERNTLLNLLKIQIQQNSVVEKQEVSEDDGENVQYTIVLKNGGE